MDAATVLRSTRHRAGLTLRELAERSGTSHATLSAYEAGRKVPRIDTLARIVRAAGFALDVTVSPRADGDGDARMAKGRELAEVLELAAMFPADAEPALPYLCFGAAGR